METMLQKFISLPLSVTSGLVTQLLLAVEAHTSDDRVLIVRGREKLKM